MNLYRKIFESSEEFDKIEAFDKELEKLGITSTSPLYYVTGAPDCHTIEDADKYYASLPSYSSVNYSGDKGNITEEQFKFIDENRDLAKQVIIRAVRNLESYGSLD